MKFCDPKTGEVFDIRTGVEKFCFGEKCDTCPMEHLCPDDYCTEWAYDHPAEAALTMGYEVVKEEPHTCFNCIGCEIENDTTEDCKQWVKRKEAPMVKMDKPFICKRLGVEVGEWFQTLMFNETAIKDELYFCVEPDGTFKTKPPNVSGSAVTFLKTIEHPDCVIHKPRFTQEEVGDAEAIQRLHQTAIEVERYLDGELGVRNTSCCLFNIRNSLFPSLRPGQSVKLSEIVGEEVKP